MNDVCNAPGLLPIETAIQNILSSINAISDNETIPIMQSVGRVLASDVKSNINVPAHNNSAMDGYAVCISDKSLTYTQVGSVFAGQTFEGTLTPGQCVRIMTGAAIAPGANGVVMQENASADGDQITFTAQPGINENIRFAGEDIAINDVILDAGDKLKAVDVGLLASLGIADINVTRKLKVAVFSTGDELIEPGQPLKKGAIYESNRAVIISALQQQNIDVLDLGIIRDDKALITQAFLSADEKADAVISSGGVSVGEADFTKEVLNEIGNIHFWKIAMKPGKPFAFGKLPNSYFFGLPGNPVSAAVTFNQLVEPALQKLSGLGQVTPKMHFNAITTSVVKKRPGRADFQRATATTNEQGDLLVTPFNKQGSGVLSSLSKANCLIVVPAQSGSIAKGETVSIEFL
ncbi:molybdopterin molybdotransferase MoeA [Pseudoalteromonas sp. MMG006]|uniref:molybdopterin molybdotransferase MoeA n=1 Tax=Pseudoalteromonas sp. MMG006 TaxID=2822683 RepID=UPI001B37267F|nr:gephyrin-like molybdotransferase Glp [Pseudoalteromonas sp. MMG006]MBQ4799276.1 molybdopterin molybdotransferase MoeA [Pseudoalteromonas sp. MMG006]